MPKETEEHFFSFGINYYDYPIRHGHKFWEFMLVTNGSYKHILNDAHSIIRRGDICLIRPGDFHSILAAEPHSTNLNMAVSDRQMKNALDALDPLLYEKILHGKPPKFSIPDKQTEHYLQFTLQHLEIQQDDRHPLLPAVFLEMLGDFYNIYVLPQDEDPLRNLPAIIVRVIDELKNTANFSSCLSEILHPLGYSYPHISRLFKQYMHTSLVSFFNNVKLDHACWLLEQTDMKIIDVGEKIGYKSLSQFNSAFRDRFNVSPSQYRKTWVGIYGKARKSETPQYPRPTPPHLKTAGKHCLAGYNEMMRNR